MTEPQQPAGWRSAMHKPSASAQQIADEAQRVERPQDDRLRGDVNGASWQHAVRDALMERGLQRQHVHDKTVQRHLTELARNGIDVQTAADHLRRHLPDQWFAAVAPGVSTSLMAHIRGQLNDTPTEGE